MIAKAKAAGSRESLTAADGTELYAYPHPSGIAWGINAAETGVNLWRGIRWPDGRDAAESRLADTPWGEAEMYIGDAIDLMHYRTAEGIARGFPFRKTDEGE